MAQRGQMKVFASEALGIIIKSISFHAFHFLFMMYFNTYKIGNLIHSNRVGFVVE